MADPEGVCEEGGRVSDIPPLEPTLFHFHREFQEKLVNLHKSNPLELI